MWGRRDRGRNREGREGSEGNKILPQCIIFFSHLQIQVYYLLFVTEMECSQDLLEVVSCLIFIQVILGDHIVKELTTIETAGGREGGGMQ